MAAVTARRLAGMILPPAAIVVAVSFLGAVLASAGETLGYDFLAYHAAAVRLIHGEAVYDLGYQQAGGFGLFLYPPTFLLLIVPFGLLDATTATWAWIGVGTAALLAGIRLLPVSGTVRWMILLLAGLSWPVAYTLKLGQVTPLLFLLAVIGWRAVERTPERTRGEWDAAPEPVSAGLAAALRSRPAWLLGASAALGAAMKIQPGLLLAWALVTRRWWAVLAGMITLAVTALLATALAGIDAWWDYAALIRQVTDPVGTDHNVTPGFVARSLGLSAELAGAVQAAVIVGALAALLVSARRSPPPVSYLLAVTVSQLISPVLWDHYAMLLLLPVAWLLARGRRWAAVIPLATALPLVSLTPLELYPVLFGLTMLALLLEARTMAPPPAPAASNP